MSPSWILCASILFSAVREKKTVLLTCLLGDAVIVHSQIRESSLKRYGVKEAIKPQMGSFLPIKFYFLHPLGKGILAEGLSLVSLP